MKLRVEKLQELIKQETSKMLLRELKDPRITPDLTIVRADLSGDMGHCKVYVSSLTDFDRAKEACRVLEKASGFIRKELFRRLKLRKSPEMHFIADDSIAYAADISEKLSGLGLTEGNTPEAEPEEDPLL